MVLTRCPEGEVPACNHGSSGALHPDFSLESSGNYPVGEYHPPEIVPMSEVYVCLRVSFYFKQI